MVMLGSHKRAMQQAKMAVRYCHNLIIETLALCNYLKEAELLSNPARNKALNSSVQANCFTGRGEKASLTTRLDWLSPGGKGELASSLSRLHTFNMRDPVHDSNTQPSEEMSSVCPSKTFYFEENLPALEKFVALYESVLGELAKKIASVDDCLDPSNDASLEKPLSPPSRSRFAAAAGFMRGKIDEMKKNKQFKIKPRSLLGIKSKDDWIYNINIGNVMHLAPLSLEDLAMSPQIAHELCRDALYEKVILLTIAYFSLATESRFLFTENNVEANLAESRYWHKAAVEIVCTFLPTECPLVGHIVSSYEKHHSLAQEVIVLTFPSSSRWKDRLRRKRIQP
jgi:hypothetical protein